SMTRTNNPNFNYLDKILEDWWKKGIKEPAETEKLLKSRPLKQPSGGNSSKRRVAPVGNRDLNKIIGID
ncbi:MAG: DnaD domain protein, partial [Peptococcia bacterium]